MPGERRGVNVARGRRGQGEAEDLPPSVSTAASRSRNWPADFSTAASKAQRRPDRPHQSRRARSAGCRRFSMPMKVGDVTEPLRTPARLSAVQGRDARRKRRSKTFEQARGDISNRVCRPEASGGAAQVSRQAARTGHDDLAQRRPQEGVRTGAREAAPAAGQPGLVRDAGRGPAAK